MSKVDKDNGLPKKEVGILTRALADIADELHGLTASQVNTAIALANCTHLLRPAEETPSESDARYRKLANRMQALIVELAPDGALLFVNNALTELTGYGPEELAGRNWFKLFFPGEALRQLDEAFRLFAAGDDITGHIASIRTKDNSWIHLDWNSANEHDAQGQVQKIILFGVDITARLRSEQLLRENEEKYRRTMDAAPTGICLVQDALIQYANPCFLSMFGYAGYEVVGKLAPSDLVIQAQRAAVVSSLYRDVAGEARRPLEVSCLRKDGNAFSAVLSVRSITHDGRPALIGTVVDLTEREQSQKKIADLTRLYGTLRHTNAIIVRVKDRLSLFSEICNMLVEEGQFNLVWIGLLDDETREVIPVAHAGQDALDYAFIQSVIGRVDEGWEPAATAIQERTVIHTNDCKAEPDSSPWRADSARGSGFRSAAALPLHSHDRCIGVLMLYAHEANFFNDEQFRVLEEILANIAFALENIEHEEKRLRAESDLQLTFPRRIYEGQGFGFSDVLDVTHHKAADGNIRYLANYDPLTGLPNRDLLLDRLSHALSLAERGELSVSVLYIDLDNLKFVNDSLGYAAGDELLKQVANRLLMSVRETDTVGRLGGDEFAVVLAGLSREAEIASFLTHRVLGCFVDPIRIHERDIFATCSIGAAVYPRDGEDIDALLTNAAAAMRRAKENGRNTFQFYASEANAKAAERLALETGLRWALEKEELSVAYQPLIDLRTAQMVGMEALLRWNNPAFGSVLPASFIPVAEESGLIVPIGEWALRTACAQNKRWQDEGHAPMTVAVNLSLRQLLRKELVPHIRETLEETGLAPEYLAIELTESMLAHDVETTVRALVALKAIGVKISLDDFGIGCFGPSYLKRFPIDTLKIDPSFVHGMTVNPDRATIVDAMISMAHSLKLSVLAEAVETKEQLGALCAGGCDLAQGRLFSEPLLVNEMERFLREGVFKNDLERLF